MSNHSFEISSRCAFSQAWNQAIDNNSSCPDKWINSIKAFMEALFFGRKIVKADIDKVFLQGGHHANSIFGKVCCKLKDKSQVSEVRLNNTEVKLNNTEEEILLGYRNNSLIKLSGRMSAVNVFADALEKLMNAEGFNINDVRFSKESLDSLDKEGCLRLLKAACELGKCDLVIRLLSAKDCNLSEYEQKNFLFLLVSNNIANGVTFLLGQSSKSVVNGLNDEGDTLLAVAAKLNYVECLNALLGDARIDINGKSTNGNISLHYAIAWNSLLCFHALLGDTRIDINMKNGNENTPINFAIIWARVSFFDALLAKIDINTNIKNQAGNTPLHAAVYIDDTVSLKKLLARRESRVNDWNNYGYAPLHSAARRGKKASIALLIKDARIDLNALTRDGDTPYTCAVNVGNMGCAELLQEHSVARAMRTFGNFSIRCLSDLYNKLFCNRH